MKTKTKAKSKTSKKAQAQPFSLPTHRKEFEIEGELLIEFVGGALCFVLDDCHLSEFVNRHFRPRIDEDGTRIVGRVKILIIPIKE